MRIRRLPGRLSSLLGLDGYKEEAPFVKKVQELYCRPMTYHDLCPRQCWRCTERLIEIAGDMTIGGPIGMWHNIIANATAEIIEEYHERQRSSGKINTSSVIAAFLETLDE